MNSDKDDLRILEALYRGNHLEPNELKRAVIVTAAIKVSLNARVR